MQQTDGIRSALFRILTLLGAMTLVLAILGCGSSALPPIVSTASFDFTDVTDIEVYVAYPANIGKAENRYTARIEIIGSYLLPKNTITESFSVFLHRGDATGTGLLYAQEKKIQKIVWTGRDGGVSFLGYIDGVYQNIPWEPKHGLRKYYLPMDEEQIPEVVKKVQEAYEATRAHFGISWDETGKILSVGIGDLRKKHGLVALNVGKRSAGPYQSYEILIINEKMASGPPEILEKAYLACCHLVKAVNGEIDTVFYLPSLSHLVRSADGTVEAISSLYDVPDDLDLAASYREAESLFHRIRSEAGVVQVAAPEAGKAK